MKVLIDKALRIIYGIVLTESCQPKFKYLVKQEKAPIKGLYLTAIAAHRLESL